MLSHDEYTDTNSVHEENQDSILADSEHSLFAVADGVGGYQGAKIASGLAVEMLAQNSKQVFTEQDLKDCILEIDGRIRSRAGELGYPMMGSTIVACKVMEDSKKVICANVGDSPMFLIRGSMSIPVYHEDSERFANPADVWSLTQYLGFSPEKPLVHSRSFECLSGDILLLCSDGVSDNILSRGMKLNHLAELVTRIRSARGLVKYAMERNFKTDDMSAVLLFL